MADKGLKIQFDTTLEEAFKHFSYLKASAYPTAVRRSLNKVVDKQFTAFRRLAQEKRAVKLGTIKQFIKKRTAKGNDIAKMESNTIISARTLPLLDFVVGSRLPRAQKGISVRRRKPISVQIIKGKKQVLKHAFIAAQRKGAPFAVFKRTKKFFTQNVNGRMRQRPVLKKQTVSSLAVISKREPDMSNIQNMVKEVASKELFRQLELEANKVPMTGKRFT